MSKRPKRPVPPPVAFSPDEVADQLDISRPTVYKLINAGELASFLIGRSRRIPASEVERVLASAQRKAPVMSARTEKDPEGVLDPLERAKRTANARSASFAGLSMEAATDKRQAKAERAIQRKAKAGGSAS